MDDCIFHLQITAPDGGTREFSIPLGITTIGRQVGNDLVLEHPQALRRHARLTRTDQEGEISDDGSSNGTCINGEKPTAEVPKILAEGDEIKIGDFRLVFHRTPVAQPEAGPEPEEETRYEGTRISIDELDTSLIRLEAWDIFAELEGRGIKIDERALSAEQQRELRSRIDQVKRAVAGIEEAHGGA